jgi:hypothetical protein
MSGDIIQSLSPSIEELTDSIDAWRNEAKYWEQRFKAEKKLKEDLLQDKGEILSCLQDSMSNLKMWQKRALQAEKNLTETEKKLILADACVAPVTQSSDKDLGLWEIKSNLWAKTATKAVEAAETARRDLEIAKTILKRFEAEVTEALATHDVDTDKLECARACADAAALAVAKAEWRITEELECVRMAEENAKQAMEQAMAVVY